MLSLLRRAALHASVLIPSAAFVAACAGDSGPSAPVGHLAIGISALGAQQQQQQQAGFGGQQQQQGAPADPSAIGSVCVDIKVDNGTDTVWQQGDPAITALAGDTASICSDQYGNGGGGDITYIGTCDAQGDSDPNQDGVQNRVTLWVDGLYNTNYNADVGGWRNPCPDGCAIQADCTADTDTQVTFNLTVLRAANQGFFDVAVNFDDIFCSAKLDTCYGQDPIQLIYGATGERDWTAVAGLTCTAGGDPDVQTTLLYGQVEVDCGADTFVLDPLHDSGNATATSNGHTLHYAVYRGTESLATCTSGDCHDLYWSFAVSLTDLQALGGQCTLVAQATANNGNQGWTAGAPTAEGLTYPYVTFDVPLTLDGVASCQANALDQPGSYVNTIYQGNVVGISAPNTMCAQFDGAAATATGGCDTGGAACFSASDVVGMSPADAGLACRTATGSCGACAGFDLGGGGPCFSCLLGIDCDGCDALLQEEGCDGICR